MIKWFVLLEPEVSEVCVVNEVMASAALAGY